MKKLLFATVLAVMAPLTGACGPGLAASNRTDVTFTIEAFNQTTLDRAAPLIDVVANIDGYAPWVIGEDVPAMYRFTITSAKYPQAAYGIDVTAELVQPNANVMLKCTWTAQTPAGRRLSRNSTGGEGESYAGGPVNCSYTA